MMRWVIPFVAFAILPSQAPSTPQSGPPATEIFLAPLNVAGAQVTVGTPENVSHGPGYDNQPFFAPDGRTLFFTSARGEVASKCGSPQTDVYRYLLDARQLARVTDTADCEYSPTVVPDGKHLSVIKVEPDGTQRLWKFESNGRNPSLVLRDVKPVGYHAWLDQVHVVLFVLGRPATLQVANVASGETQVVAHDIGQSIQRMPGGGVSFVQQSGEGDARTLTITEVRMENGKPAIKPLITAPRGARQAHLAWTPDGTLLMAHEGTLHAWKAGEPAWRAVADLTALGLRDVTRLAVSPNGDRLAIVASR